MANSIQTIEDGPRNLVIKVDGAGGDTLAKIIDVATLAQPCTRVTLQKLHFQLAPAGTADLFWEATANVVLLHLYGGNDCDLCFEYFTAIPNNAGVGITGNVLLTTSANPYSLILHFIKRP